MFLQVSLNTVVVREPQSVGGTQPPSFPGYLGAGRRGVCVARGPRAATEPAAASRARAVSLLGCPRPPKRCNSRASWLRFRRTAGWLDAVLVRAPSTVPNRFSAHIGPKCLLSRPEQPWQLFESVFDEAPPGSWPARQTWTVFTGRRAGLLGRAVACHCPPLKGKPVFTF